MRPYSDEDLRNLVGLMIGVFSSFMALPPFRVISTYQRTLAPWKHVVDALRETFPLPQFECFTVEPFNFDDLSLEYDCITIGDFILPYLWRWHQSTYTLRLSQVQRLELGDMMVRYISHARNIQRDVNAGHEHYRRAYFVEQTRCWYYKVFIMQTEVMTPLAGDFLCPVGGEDRQYYNQEEIAEWHVHARQVQEDAIYNIRLGVFNDTRVFVPEVPTAELFLITFMRRTFEVGFVQTGVNVPAFWREQVENYWEEGDDYVRLLDHLRRERRGGNLVGELTRTNQSVMVRRPVAVYGMLRTGARRHRVRQPEQVNERALPAELHFQGMNRRRERLLAHRRDVMLARHDAQSRSRRIARLRRHARYGFCETCAHFKGPRQYLNRQTCEERRMEKFVAEVAEYFPRDK